jgi:glycosyltransferase involved in cell wall biosynthesis
MDAQLARKFGGFVMTYNRASILPGTLRSLLNQTVPPEVIMVIDNASTDQTPEIVKTLGNPAVHYLRLHTNGGPSGAARQGIQWAINEGLEWIYWGDDDDPPADARAFERLLCMVDSYGGGDVGAIGVVGTRWDWRRGEMKRLADHELSGPVEVDMIGGGGTFLIHRRAFATVAPPSEAFFFSHEDSEYCLRIRQAGLKVVVDGDQMFESRRRAGRLNLQSKAELRRRWSVPHAQRPKRQYYSTRNYIFMMRRTFDRPDLARREAMKAVARCGRAWLRGPGYGMRFTRLQLRAILDGYRGRMGATVPLR